jgi:TonB family protein
MHRGAPAILVAAAALSTGAFAQPATGSLTGVVVDAATQSPLADAVVIARGPSLVGEQSAVTDEAGAFEMTLLPPGTYGLTVKRDGFQAFAPEGLVLKGHRVKIRLLLLPVVVPSAPVESAVEFNDNMTAPVMVSGPPPEYTPEAVDRGVQGPMSVRCVITVEGAVRNCKVLKSLPYMDHAVIEALVRRKYQPATLQGKPVDVYYTFNLKLKLPQQ